jgi:hypothetical protein
LLGSAKANAFAQARGKAARNIFSSKEKNRKWFVPFFEEE